MHQIPVRWDSLPECFLLALLADALNFRYRCLFYRKHLDTYCTHIIFARVAIHCYNSVRVYQESGGFMVFYLMIKNSFRMGGIHS